MNAARAGSRGARDERGLASKTRRMRVDMSARPGPVSSLALALLLALALALTPSLSPLLRIARPPTDKIVRCAGDLSRAAVIEVGPGACCFAPPPFSMLCHVLTHPPTHPTPSPTSSSPPTPRRACARTGPGALTRSLLRAGAPSVVVVEKDERFLPSLQLLAQAAGSRLDVVLGDVLTVQPSSLLRRIHEREGWRETARTRRRTGTELL